MESLTHICNPSTGENEAGRLSQAQGKPQFQSKTPPQKEPFSHPINIFFSFLPLSSSCPPSICVLTLGLYCSLKKGAGLKCSRLGDSCDSWRKIFVLCLFASTLAGKSTGPAAVTTTFFDGHSDPASGFQYRLKTSVSPGILQGFSARREHLRHFMD